jgi:hypothetical protein
MKNHSLAAIAAAVIGVVGMASQADAIDIYASGSSAGRQFINEVPLSVCDHNAGAITHYRSGNNNMHLWQCTFSNQPINFHYSARGSSDGVYPVDDLSGGDRSKGKYNNKGYFGFIKSSNPILSGCTGNATVVQKTFFDVDTSSMVTINVDEWTNCTNPPSAVTTDWSDTLYDRVPTHFGFSDVQFASFGQTSPAGTEPADPAPNLTEHQLMVLPFSIVVQNSVRRVDANGNNIGPVQNLTQTEIEQIFTRGARDWRELGYALTNDVDGNEAVPSGCTQGTTGCPIGGAHTIRLCMREFGSGSKATFDQVLMKEEAGEWNTNLTNTAFYFASSSGVRDCLNDVTGTGAYGKIGYIDSFEATGTPGYVSPQIVSPISKAHVVNVNGFRGVDATVACTGGPAPCPGEKAALRPKVFQALRCGKTEFWVNLEGYTKTAGTGDATRDAFIARFMSDAANTSVVENLPANWAFEATPNILATKTQDNIAPDHATYGTRATEYNNQCRGFYASSNPTP